MSLCPSVTEILRHHVTLELESLDRVYLNVYQPRLQSPRGVAAYCRGHLGYPYASSALLHPISKAFVAKIKAYAQDHEIPLVAFRKGERKDDVAAWYLERFRDEEGILFVGRAQEKTPVFRTERRRNPATGQAYPWIVASTAMVNHFYWYGVDADFGPFFFKFATYFPYTAKFCFNGHHWLERQARRRGIIFEAQDNAILRCEDPRRLQRLADSLDAGKIETVVRKWLRRLPHPFSPEDLAAGFRYDISILQAEFCLTQVLDRPVTGRHFFEEVIRENLDLGRPDQVALIFNRRVTKKTPGRFRTRVITEGVIPSLHIDYKRTRCKQYHKLGRALRTETTINDARDFRIGKRLENLPALREVGFQANRRLLDVERISHDCAIGEDAFVALNRPVEVRGQRVPALRFAEPRVQALLSVLLVFRIAQGFSARDLRVHLAPLLGPTPSLMTPGQTTYELRRLRLRGLIERIPRTHRYRVTDFGLRSALFLTRTYARLLRPGLAEVLSPEIPSPVRSQLDKLDGTIARVIGTAGLSA